MRQHLQYNAFMRQLVPDENYVSLCGIVRVYTPHNCNISGGNHNDSEYQYFGRCRTNWLPSDVSRGEEAETDYLAMLREAARCCKFVHLRVSPDSEAELIWLHINVGLRDRESKLKLLEALRANDNLTI